MDSKKKTKISKSDFIDRLNKLCGKNDLMQFPKNHTDRLVLLGSIALALKPKKVYSEKKINEIILEWIKKMAKESYLDHVTLRRYLIDFGLIERDPDGRQYHISESNLYNLFEDTIRTINPFVLVKKFRKERAEQRKKWIKK